MPKQPLSALPVTIVVRIAHERGVSCSAVLGNDRLFLFRADGVCASIHTLTDMEYFGASSVLRLVSFFQARLSVNLFWESSEDASA